MYSNHLTSTILNLLERVHDGWRKINIYNNYFYRDPQRVKVLENYAALATRQKLNVDRAMQSFVEMLDNDQDYLPAVLGMATGFMIEKNQVKSHYSINFVSFLSTYHYLT